MLTDFVDGPILDRDLIRSPGMLERIGRTLRAFHAAGEIGRFSIFEHQHRYTEMARAEALNLPPTSTRPNRVASDIEASLARAQTPDRLCHNDLQLPNFIITDPTLVVLDWEWAGMGDPYFDLGATAVMPSSTGQRWAASPPPISRATTPCTSPGST